MQTLTMTEQDQLEGGDFWSGFACGFGAVGVVVGLATANPFMLYVGAGAALKCITS